MSETPPAPSGWTTISTVSEKDAQWTVGLSSEGTIDLVIGSASGGHRCTLSLGYAPAKQLSDRLAAVLTLCKPPTENR